jgi:S-adenosylmethionine decarboxylase proenzyme
MSNILDNSYDFYGTHYLSSFNECNKLALINIDILRESIKNAIIDSGATIIDYTEKIFDNSGYTIVYLLSESHCSVHTYPEHNAMFTDFFTCGNNCSYERYENHLKKYLEPQDIQKNVIIRTQNNKILT